MEFTGNKSVITPEGVFIIGTYDEKKRSCERANH